jgi:cobalt/nickel transport system permease protein
MHIDIDEKAHLNSVLHRMDLRLKIISIFASALIISSCRTVSSAGASIIFAMLLTFFSGIPLTFYLKKLYLPLIFLIPLFLFLPFSSGGDVLFQLYYISIYKEGIILSSVIGLKVISIIILINIIPATASFRDISAALKALRVPDKMLNIILFSYRYFFVFFEDLRKMRVALTLRGFRTMNPFKSLKSSSYLAGSILVRSFEQTERIYMAMMLRGYSGRVVTDKTFHAGPRDILLTLMITAVPLIILFRELNGLFN